MLSIVIPAHNEAAYLGPTLDAARSAAEALGLQPDILVVDDDSTDTTAALAEAHGARVLSVQLRQIAAVRNAGAAHAYFDHLVFLDADTFLPAATLRAALSAMQQGTLGGGARVRFDGQAPLGAKLTVTTWNLMARTCRWAAGCFVFAHRHAFESVGGFNTQFYAAEEIAFSQAMKQKGPFTVLRESVITSDRKVRDHGLWAHWRTAARVICTGGKALHRRQGLDLWYGDIG